MDSISVKTFHTRLVNKDKSFEVVMFYCKSCHIVMSSESTIKLGDKERFDKERIDVKEPFPMTNCQFTS